MNTGFKKILNFFNPEPLIGGLEISDTFIRFVQFRGAKAKIISLKLPPAAVEDGKIKDKGQLLLALSNLHGQLVLRKKKKIYVIASISDGNVYTEIFSLPKSAESDLNQAANLNLRMISPIDFEDSYSDWQTVGEKTASGLSQLEILSAFVQKKTIDDFEEIIKQSGFDIAAIEFPSLALARALGELGDNFDRGKNYFLMKVASEGLSFSLFKNNNLYFMHFVSWASAYGQNRQVTFESIKNLTISEIRKVLGFYENHWNESLVEIILVTPTLREEIAKIIEENFSNLKVRNASLKQFQNLEPSWFSVVGSALRGLISRSQDVFISLASSGTEENFKNYQVISFIKIWRNTILTFLAAILAFLGGLNFLLASNYSELEARKKDISLNPEFDVILELRQEAQNFNQKVNFLSVAAKERNKWSPFANKIIELSNASDIILKRIFIQSADSPVLLVGEATNEDKVFSFKKVLGEQTEFSNINFQLSNFSQTGGKFTFSITLNAKNLK